VSQPWWDTWSHCQLASEFACTQHSDLVDREFVSRDLAEEHSRQASKFPICLEESSIDSLEIISCLVLAWMSPLHDLAGWSLFLVLQDHDEHDYGASSLARTSAQPPSTILLVPFAHFTFERNKRASCTTPCVPTPQISSTKSCFMSYGEIKE
jgi:hypothetical protein